MGPRMLASTCIFKFTLKHIFKHLYFLLKYFYNKQKCIGLYIYMFKLQIILLQ